MDKTFIFDYDDTLAPNQHYYSQAQHNFVGFVLAEFDGRSPNVQEIVNLQVGLDMDLVKTMGFDPKRFCESFRISYRKIREGLGLPRDEAREDLSYQFGFMAFDEDSWRKEGLFPGVRETLDFLVSQEDELVVLTKGDFDIQRRKLIATDCSKWFGPLNGDRVYIVPEKDAEVFRRVLGERNPDTTYAVGNSAKSDILPALKVGMKAIYVPQETWAYEKTADVSWKTNPRLRVFREIQGIVDNYSELH